MLWIFCRIYVMKVAHLLQKWRQSKTKKLLVPRLRHQWILQIQMLKSIWNSLKSSSDVGLRCTCAYYRTSARAMCVRKCVRKRFETVCAMCVRVARFWACDVRLHFCTLFRIKQPKNAIIAMIILVIVHKCLLLWFLITINLKLRILQQFFNNF